MLSRRAFVASTLAAPLLRPQANRVRIGITDWNLRLTVKPESIPLAAKLGFEGVQVSCGRCRRSRSRRATLCSAASASSAPRQAGHLSLHARRPVARRSL